MNWRHRRREEGGRGHQEYKQFYTSKDLERGFQTLSHPTLRRVIKRKDC